jgi:hypothetical protein
LIAWSGVKSVIVQNAASVVPKKRSAQLRS